MARNGGKSRGAQPRSSSGGGSGRGLFFAGGLLLGLLLAFGVYLLQILPTALELRERAKAHAAACEEAAAKTDKPKGDAAKPGADNGEPVKFEFYTMLPKQQVVAPVTGNKTTVATPPPTPTAEEKAAAKPPASAPATTTPAPAAGGKYLLQAGSFRTRDEADRRRAQLLLSGLPVSVQGAKLANGETWHRVMVGPFTDEAAMLKAQKQLAAMKVDTLPVRPK
ncbi:MAG: SPOR domain-containing protein [Pseudomonadota bacterium]